MSNPRLFKYIDPGTIVLSKRTLNSISRENGRLLPWMLGKDLNEKIGPGLTVELHKELNEHHEGLVRRKKSGCCRRDQLGDSKIRWSDVVFDVLAAFSNYQAPWNERSNSTIPIDVRRAAFIDAGFTEAVIDILKSLPIIGIGSSDVQRHYDKGTYTPPFLAAYEIVWGTFPYNFPYWYRAYAILRHGGYSHYELTG